MTSREQITTELNQLSDQELDDLYPIVQEFIERRRKLRKPGIMSQLRQVQIEAPKDFSTNFDSYLNGEKQLPEQSDLH